MFPTLAILNAPKSGTPDFGVKPGNDGGNRGTSVLYPFDRDPLLVSRFRSSQIVIALRFIRLRLLSESTGALFEFARRRISAMGLRLRAFHELPGGLVPALLGIGRERGQSEGDSHDGGEGAMHCCLHANDLVTGRRVRQKKSGAIGSWRRSKKGPHQVLKSRDDIELRFAEMVVVRSASVARMSASKMRDLSLCRPAGLRFAQSGLPLLEVLRDADQPCGTPEAATQKTKGRSTERLSLNNGIRPRSNAQGTLRLYMQVPKPARIDRYKPQSRRRELLLIRRAI
jgi:hypothetical protein